MQILSANYIITCDDNFKIIKNGAIVFDKQIIEIDEFKKIKQKYTNIDIKFLGKNSVIMPGVINPHIHLEFSKNKDTLQYGSFSKWLNSVIANRDNLLENIDDEFILDTLNNLIKQGTTTIGAISSQNLDLNSCVKSNINVVYFNEILGSKVDILDFVYNDFLQKLKIANSYKSNSFIPAIAIHSPYSTHPMLIKKVLELAKKENYLVQAHFLESLDEYNWLHFNSGGLEDFFKNFLNQTKALISPKEFLELFKNNKHLAFTHCVYAKEYLDELKKLDATIIHCPNSNRLLTNETLNLDDFKNFNIALATDGLSSNYSIDLFDEMKSALFIHKDKDIYELAKKLLLFATKNGARYLRLNKGVLEKGKDADFICLQLDEINSINSLPLNIILNKKIKRVYIGGDNEII